MHARLCVAGFSYSFSGKNGISLGLESIQKTRDGESLFGRSNPAEVFADEPDDILAWGLTGAITTQFAMTSA